LFSITIAAAEMKMFRAGAPSNFWEVADLFIVDFSGGDEERARREAERVAESARLRDRYVRHVVDSASVDEATAQRVIASLFESRDRGGRTCDCGCHPRLSSQHGDGFDCPCSWDDARRASENRKLRAFWDTESAAELRAAHQREEEDITVWLSGQPQVDAMRTTSMAPEQWKGTVDGHSFYFRERGGFWRIELDMAESGEFAQRFVEVAGDGSLVTEPVPIMEGEVIAEGIDSQLGATPVEHIGFIVRTIRDRLWEAQCDHRGALFYCPKCGQRMSEAR
jgi:hypothetical protein